MAISTPMPDVAPKPRCLAIPGWSGGGEPDHEREGSIARRQFRNLMEVYGQLGLDGIKSRITEIEHGIEHGYPGKKDPPYIQRLKGMCREWEAECLWGYFGYNCKSVRHLRLGFYTGDIFTEEPTASRDVPPILGLLEEVEPHVITVALDPEASGPDTHYKVLQAISEALRQYVAQTERTDIHVWGYRNVWFRFHPSEANRYVPVSLNMISIMRSAFMNTFISQKEASFPSHEHDGPFCELAQNIQVEQYQKLKTCLGREWFPRTSKPANPCGQRRRISKGTGFGRLLFLQPRTEAIRRKPIERLFRLILALAFPKSIT